MNFVIPLQQNLIDLEFLKLSAVMFAEFQNQ
jgi:hypothetical protein